MEDVDDDSCFVCGKPGEAKCSRCHAISYCGPDCQRKDWKRHKAECGKPAAAPTYVAAEPVAAPPIKPAPVAISTPIPAVAPVPKDVAAAPPAVTSTATASPTRVKEPSSGASPPATPSQAKKGKNKSKSEEREKARKASEAPPPGNGISHSGIPGKAAPIDVFLSGQESLQNAQRVVDILKERGVVVLKAGADKTFQKALYMEANQLWDGDLFGEAQKGSPSRPGGTDVRFDSRDDKIIWMHKEWCQKNQRRCQALKVLDDQLTGFGFGLKQLLEDQLGLSMNTRSPAMLACYAGEHAPGARYDYHIDNPYQTQMKVPDDGRRLTVLYYISDGAWDVSKDGGGLQVALSNPRKAPKTTSEALTYDKMTISPESDTLVCFFAHTMYHAVLPVMGTRRRFALSTWFQDKK